jgi:hypothetical protein
VYHAELSRAFLASFILVMDLLIVMQDWDFPHFTTTLHVNLPGFSVATLKWKYAEVDITGEFSPNFYSDTYPKGKWIK